MESIVFFFYVLLLNFHCTITLQYLQYTSKYLTRNDSFQMRQLDFKTHTHTQTKIPTVIVVEVVVVVVAAAIIVIAIAV